jgi:hypothetical protein
VVAADQTFVKPGCHPVPIRSQVRRPIRGPRLLFSLSPSATTSIRETAPRSVARWLPLATFLDRLGRHEPAATIAGFALSPLTALAFPEINTAIAHLREALGDQTYESLAHKGETMTTSAMATYAYDQIDQARTELNTVSE